MPHAFDLLHLPHLPEDPQPHILHSWLPGSLGLVPWRSGRGTGQIVAQAQVPFTQDSFFAQLIAGYAQVMRRFFADLSSR